jgi:hypothetical protein
MTDPKQDTIMPFTKTVALASFSTESLQDLSYFMQFVPAEGPLTAAAVPSAHVISGWDDL